MGSVLLQTPVALMGIQPYFATGGGFYQEELGTRRDRGLAVGCAHYDEAMKLLDAPAPVHEVGRQPVEQLPMRWLRTLGAEIL